MRLFLLCLLATSQCYAFGQNMDVYFEKIRNNPAKLTAFMAQMPKGGDLHHHYSGSVYAETYVEYVVKNDYFIRLRTLEVKEKTTVNDTGFLRFSEVKNMPLAAIKQKLMQKWSVKDYNGIYPSDKQFFETFGAFSPAVSKTWDQGLMELKQRAKAEKLSYIETMFTTIKCSVAIDGISRDSALLEAMQYSRNVEDLVPVFDQLYNKIIQDDSFIKQVPRFNQTLAQRHKRLQLDDSIFTIRYQNYMSRTNANPVDMFKNIVVAFESADKSPLIVGVNIVAPEDDAISLRDYWLHMQMFRYCSEKYPNVKYAMHAGELALGYVKPEELTWHIHAAVYEAKARRIGHGVDLPYENQSTELLNYMSKNDIAVEINLYSNEFILKVKDGYHPVMMYRENKVPIVICTDDAGVLRSSLTHQYILLASRYKDIKYKDIKEFVFNSISYSFIEDPSLVQQLIKDLELRFRAFESDVLRAEAK